MLTGHLSNDKLARRFSPSAPSPGYFVIDLLDIRYVRLGTASLEVADRFAREIVGLELARASHRTRHYRSDQRDHTLVFLEGNPADHTIGFELRGIAELTAAAAELSDAGLAVRAGTAAECEQRRVGAFVNFRDATGNKIDLVIEPDRAVHIYRPPTATGITGFSHIGLCSTAPRRDERFWTGTLGARISDRIGNAAFLRIDEIHHKVALIPTTHAGVQHVNHQVAAVDDIMRPWYRLRERGVRILFGPGRHPTSEAVFLYFQGPDGMTYEFSTGVRTISAAQEAAYRPRQLPAAPASFCMWGALPDIDEFRTNDSRP